MNIRLMGTGASDGIPSFYGNDPVSKFARENGGKDIRTRAAALVDGHLKIDLGPDTLCQLNRDRLSARDWSGLVFTHGHEDHFCPSEIQYALFPFVNEDKLEFSIYGNEQIVEVLQARYPDWPMETVITRSFEPFQHADYKITPIRARHKEDEDSQNLIIQRGDKTLVYATDTGVWPHETFAFLDSFKIDCLVIECTDGINKGTYLGHLDVEACVEMVDALRQSGVLHSRSRVVTTHHAASGGARHCDLEKILGKHRIEPGYDGMIVKF